MNDQKLPDNQLSQDPGQNQNPPKNLKGLNLEPSIIFEDDHLLVLNKPAGLIVNRANSVKDVTLQDWVEVYLANDPAWEKGRVEDETFRERSGMIHRLDKDTSGIIIFAKLPEIMFAMMAKFKAREVQKTYLALVHEHFSEPTGLISASIARHPKERERFSVTSTGRPSVTHYQVEREYSDFNLPLLQKKMAAEGEIISGLGKLVQIYQGFTLVKLQPKTGRTHQLRVHLKFLHHPIVGDERYVGRKRYRIDKLWCQRQWLHAWKIEFYHPATGQKLEFNAPLPADLEQSLLFIQSA